MKALVAKSCPALCIPMDCSPPCPSRHRILQARILELVAIPFFRGFPDPGNEPRSPALQVDSLPMSHLRSPINYDRFIKWNAIFWLKSGNNQVSIHSCCSVTKSCPTLCDPWSPGFPVSHYLLEFVQLYVHWLGNVIQPSHPQGNG